MAKHTLNDLYQMQSLPLSAKVQMTRQRIRGWIDEYGEDGVYISFSGGKDSTVLLDIVRKDFPDITAMFVDVPTQYPELKQFALQFDNVDIVRPKKNFFQVCEEYGFPLISKEVSECVDGARKYMKALTDRQTDRQTDRPLPYKYCHDRVSGQGEYSKFSSSLPNENGGAELNTNLNSTNKFCGFGKYQGVYTNQRKCDGKNSDGGVP